jgi:hypothetical protein
MKVPRLQILTAGEILEGKKPQLPFGHSEGYKKATRETPDEQHKLF